MRLWVFELPLPLAAQGSPGVDDLFVDIVSVSVWSLCGWLGKCLPAGTYVVVLVCHCRSDFSRGILGGGRGEGPLPAPKIELLKRKSSILSY